MGVLDQLLDEEDLQPVAKPAPVLETSEAIPVEPPKKVGVLDQLLEEENEDVAAAKTNKNIVNNSAVQEAAMRFVKERLGMTEISAAEAMDEFVEHFREFNVNELTAAGDYRYVSAAAADATKRGDEKAAQRLSDYRLLYQTFSEMPSFSDGFWKATGDYAEGILKAPSTYVGLALPGAGKAGGVAATQAAKQAVNRTLAQALKTPVTTLASKAAANPIKTAVLVEGTAGTLQNVAAQKAEMAADLREDYSPTQTALAFGLSGAPVGVLGVLAKGKAEKAIEAGTDDIVTKATEAVAKADKAALEEATKTLDKNRVLARTVAGALNPLDPELVAKGKGAIKDVAGEKDLTPDFTVSLDENRTKRIFAAATEILGKQKDGLLDGERVTEGVARVIRSMDEKQADSGLDFLKGTLEKYNITHDDLANMFMADVSDAARKLQQAGASSRVFKRLNSVASDNLFALDDVAKESVKKVATALDEADPRKALEAAKKLEGKEAGVGAFVRALDTARLASMTSQTATTIRNTVSGYTRVGIDTLVTAMDRGIASSLKVAGKGKDKVGLGSVTPNEDIFALTYGLMNKKEAKAVTEIFDMGFHTKATGLFRELQDIDPKGASGSAKIEKLRAYGKELNRLNTLSDNMFKRAAFVGSLKRQLNELYNVKGGNVEDFNLVNIIKEGKFNSVFGTKEGKTALDKAVEDALYFTYQRSPSSPTARAIIQGIHSAPFLTTSLVPFPRFIANAMRFTYEYSPLYLLQGGARSFAKDSNNYEEVSKALVGTGLLAGAYAFRSSENAGENWYEYKMDNGQTFDMRPFFPAAPYLFVADMMKRYRDNDPLFGDRSFLTDSIQALTGTQFRAGFGIYAIDSALEDLSKDDLTAGDKAEKLAANFGANVVSTFTIPLTAGQDLYNTFLAPDDELIVRQTETSNVFDLIVNKSLARVPANYALEKYLAEHIGYNAPEIYEVPSKAEPMRRQLPITRQLTGALLKERRNFLEDELARLKITRRVLSAKTGVPEADQLINTLIGEYATDYIVPTLQKSEKYKNMPADEQTLYIKNVISDYKGDIMDLVKLMAKSSGKDRYGFDPMERVAFKKLNDVAKRKAYEEYHERFGEPKEGEFYDYEVLTQFGKFFDKIIDLR
jgi:hypothetical protein